MATFRKDKNGVWRAQAGAWITKRAYLVASRRALAMSRKNLLKRVTIAEICGAILEEQLK